MLNISVNKHVETYTLHSALKTDLSIRYSQNKSNNKDPT